MSKEKTILNLMDANQELLALAMKDMSNFSKYDSIHLKISEALNYLKPELKDIKP